MKTNLDRLHNIEKLAEMGKNHLQNGCPRERVKRNAEFDSNVSDEPVTFQG
ncbi:hypothetical protein HYC85_014786 [Camellia sinensis]|uniref:Uncharacterized protein n=1 Tax=Camellia sinensis TaxID=4442 RepID=A0A7J7H7G8_CAMSI|nr:hypothetical protein HYC85_014786 [Camellia sinensis]